MPARRFAGCLAPAALLLAGMAAPVSAEGIQFVPAPHVELNRVYRLDTLTGEVGACQYGLKDQTVGVTLCYPAGEGAGAQPPGQYALIASNHQKEAGIFRVNRRTGEMSICFVLDDEKVVCTPMAK
jgi:hypothetical protein